MAAVAPEPLPLTGHSPAGEVVLTYLRDQVAAIRRYDPLVRLDEPDAVHQMRVATRRARSALQAFGGIIEREATRPLCAIHEARKATKRARYAAEAAVPALGSTASRHAAQAKELQQLLGDHHDSVVARTVLLNLAGKARAAGEDTFTYGLMHQREACLAATIEQTLPQFGEPPGLV